MSNNPLAGLRIPALDQIVDAVMESVPKTYVDLGNPIMRGHLWETLRSRLGQEFEYELERALQAATSKAVEHVFRVMRDVDYQEKKQASQKRRKVARDKRDAEVQAAKEKERMDDTKKRLVSVPKGPKVVLQ